jgi:hypothetical protein
VGDVEALDARASRPAEGVAQGLEALLAAGRLLLAHQQREAGVVLGHPDPGPLVLVAGGDHHHLAFDDRFEGLAHRRRVEIDQDTPGQG